MTCSNPLTQQVRREAEAMTVGAGVCTGAQGLEGGMRVSELGSSVALHLGHCVSGQGNSVPLPRGQ